MQTQHSVTIAGQEIRYTVTTGVIVLKEESEKKGEKEGELGGGAAPGSASSSPLMSRTA